MNPAARELHACVLRARAVLRKRPPSGESVHEARKALKKARAALRLLRPALGETRFREENEALRDAGRFLAPARDIRSARIALEDLGAASLARVLQVKEEKARRALRIEACLEMLERARRDDLSHLDASRLDAGLRRTYRKGREALARAQEQASAEALHEWRKQVKYLFHSLQALGASGTKAARRADKLAGRLGEDHDLALLSTSELPGAKLRKRIDARRSKLQKRAFALGKKLYGSKPKRFVKNLS